MKTAGALELAPAAAAEMSQSACSELARDESADSGARRPALQRALSLPGDFGAPWVAIVARIFEWRFTGAARAIGVVVLVGWLASGCSIRRMAVNRLGDALAGGGTTFASDDDPELVKAAVPFSLKLMESLLAENPRHKGLLFATASGFTQYAYAFVQQDADEMEDKDLAAATAMRARARKLYLRARDYGLRGLETWDGGIRGGGDRRRQGQPGFDRRPADSGGAGRSGPGIERGLRSRGHSRVPGQLRDEPPGSRGQGAGARPETFRARSGIVRRTASRSPGGAGRGGVGPGPEPEGV